MRKFISYFAVLTGLVMALCLTSGVSYAQTDTGTDPAILDDPDVFTLSELGYTEQFMTGPYGTLDLFFSIPDDWELAAGTYMQLNFSYSVGVVGTSSLLGSPNLIGGSLLVRYNNEVLSSILLAGAPDNSITLNIPVEAFVTDSDDGRQHVRFFLDASIHCDEENVDTIVFIKPDSYVKFVYTEKAPMNDLSEFPRPFYLPDSIVPAGVTVVLPDNPDSSSIESGVAISAGLGSASNGESIISIKEWSAVTEEEKANEHLMFIGMPNQFPDLQDLDFPIAINDGNLNLGSDVSEDGVIQSITSPWNPTKSILFVSGNSDAAVIKAAKAVSSGKIVVSGPNNLSLVDAVTATTVQESPVIDQTLNDLGFTTSTLGIFGDVYYDLKFFATADQARSEGAYIDIVSTRSNLLDFGRSGGMLLLNDEVVGTLSFSEGDSTVTTERFELLPNFVRRGENRLEIVTSLLPYDMCYTTDLEATWVTISDTSSVHLPVSERQTTIGEKLDLGLYPLMFTGDNQLSDLAFVVPSGNPAAVETAAQIAYYLGNQGTLTLANFKVYFPDEVTDDVLANNNLIFIGRATQLPLLADINNQLPASFNAGSDVANQPDMPVNYSVLPDTGLGYVQLLPSPWNDANALMLVMGNSDQGLLYAKDAVSVQTMIGDLIGNYASVFGEQVLSVDTRLMSGSAMVVTEEPGGGGGDTEATQTQEPTPGPGMLQERPPWLIPTILITTGLMVVLIIIAAVRGRKPGA